MSINQEVADNLQSIGLQGQESIIVGVSGGADSLALLSLLHNLGYETTAVYVDHGLRPTSKNDGDHVEAFCIKRCVPFRRIQVEASKHARETGKTIEEAARDLRYAALFSVAVETGAGAVAVAHHADDQVETAIMHLLRGAGMSGLRGMQMATRQHGWQEGILLIRPLLTIWKEDILAYCEHQAIQTITDESNFDTTFFRNRLRHELIPYLESYNPAVKRHLLTMATLLQDDYAVLQDLVDDAASALTMESINGQVTFLVSPFLGLHKALQRMILRKAIAILRPALRDVDAAAIDRCVAYLAQENPTGQMDVTDHISLFIDNPVCVLLDGSTPYFRKDIPLLDSTTQSFTCGLGKEITLNPYWGFRCDLVAPEETVKNDRLANQWIARVDAAQCGQTLYLASIKTGDRFYPQGLGGHTQKVSDILINQKVHRLLRDRYPLVRNEHEIVWVPGYRIHHQLQINNDTRKVLVMQFFRLAEN